MKLMMICDYPMSPSDINGGVAAAAYNLIHALLEHTSMQITAIGFWPDFTDDKPQIIDQGRLRVIRCPQAKPRAHMRDYLAERKIFAQMIKAEAPHIIHAQSEGIYASVAVNSGRPNVYTIHGIRLKEIEMSRPEIGYISYFLRCNLIKRHHRKATNIVAINRYTENEVRDLHNAKVRIIHNAVDESFFALYSPEEKAPGRLLQVGGVRSRKDIVTCLKAVTILRKTNPQIHLDVVGPNSDDCLPEAEKYIEEHQLSDNVSIHGLVSSETLEALYKRADIFVMSSVEESSPIAIVQAMAAGLPVVSTDVGGIAEMVTSGENAYLVDPRDAKSLADRLNRLVGDRLLRENFARGSRRIASEDWSTKSVALKTYDMYREIVGE